ncbi:unnamed protein product, partial [Discosporangium mesarthrocarpum]
SLIHPLTLTRHVWMGKKNYSLRGKSGEDVRQDQLGVHMISLMDRQLKEAGLDLQL